MKKNPRKRNEVISAGSIIISKPFQYVVPLKRACILLLSHDYVSGSSGIVLNNAGPEKASLAFNELIPYDGRLYDGGDQRNPYFGYIHNFSFLPGSIWLSNNIYHGGDWETLCKLIRTKKINYRMIRFYSGLLRWRPGQLDRQVKRDRWWINTENINLGELFSTTGSSTWKDIALKNSIGYGDFSDIDEPSLN